MDPVSAIMWLGYGLFVALTAEIFIILRLAESEKNRTGTNVTEKLFRCCLPFVRSNYLEYTEIIKKQSYWKYYYCYVSNLLLIAFFPCLLFLALFAT